MTQTSGARQSGKGSQRRDLKSDIKRLEATIRVSVDEQCPMTFLNETGSIQHVKHDDSDCTVEFVTDDLEGHCGEIEARDGICDCSDFEDNRDQEIVRLTSQHPGGCICSTFDRHGFAPQITGYSDGHLVIDTTFSNRDQFQKLISDLRVIADSVQVDTLKEATSSGTGSLSTSIDINVLTETQRGFLKLALEEGYFDSPRGISQAELADELDISPSMVSRRIRSIELRLFSQIECSLDIC